MFLAKSGSSIGARPLQLPDASSSEVQHHLDTCMQHVCKQLATQTDVDRKHLAQTTCTLSFLFAQEGRNAVNEETGQPVLMRLRARPGKCNDHRWCYSITLLSSHAWSSVKWHDPSLFSPLILLQTSHNLPCTIHKCYSFVPHDDPHTSVRGIPSVCEVIRDSSDTWYGLSLDTQDGGFSETWGGLWWGLCPWLGYWHVLSCPEVLLFPRSLYLWLWLALYHITRQVIREEASE